MKLKICGMKHNIEEVADLQPDYLGFIFWKPSKRYFDGPIPLLSRTTGKVGVFVDGNIDEIIRLIDALDHNAKHGEVCPAGWHKGDEGITPSHKGIADYLASNAEKL